jgi:hypothetical protein
MPRDTLAKFVFLHLVGSVGHVVHLGVARERNVDSLFFLLDWERYGFDKKCAGTRYAELVILHLVGSEGHLVHSGASEERNDDALFLMLGWLWYRFHKKHVGTR